MGYTAYDPFGLIPGKSYPYTVRLFVAPAINGWVRVLSDQPILPELIAQTGGICLSVALKNDDSIIHVYENGVLLDDPVAALEPYLRPGQPVTEIRRALTEATFTVLPPAEQPMAVLPIDALPADVQNMAKNLNPADIEKLSGKMLGNLFGKGGAQDDVNAAQALMAQQGINWNSAGGQRINLLMGLLTVPKNWREPDFVKLRDAYSLHKRRERKPDARLYPGDAETMQAVPDALAYTPIYAGKEA